MAKKQDIPKLLVDVEEKSGIAERILDLPELFPNAEKMQLGFEDPETGEYIQCCDFTNEHYAFACEHKIIHTWESDPTTGRYREGDFHNSLISGLLIDQCAKMRRFFESNRSVLCEGYLLNYAVAHPRQRGLAYSTMGKIVRSDISFTECYNQDDLLEKLFWINLKSGSEPATRMDVRTIGGFKISPIESLNRIKGFGIKAIKSAFKEYGNIFNIIENREILHKLKFIGPKKEMLFNDWLFEEVLIEEDEKENDTNEEYNNKYP